MKISNNFRFMKNYTIIFLILVTVFSGCETEDPHEIEGYKPVYATIDDIQNIYSTGPVIITSPGKIYLKDSLVFIGEEGKGVHIIDNSDKTNPQKIAFINIPGNHDIAVKGNIMYADNMTDLVAIDISDIQNIQVVKRISNIYPEYGMFHPEQVDCYFECVDTTKGFVLRWEKALLIDPKCRR